MKKTLRFKVNLVFLFIWSSVVFTNQVALAQSKSQKYLVKAKLETNNDKKIKLYQKAIKYNTDNRQAYYELGMLYWKLGQH